MEIIEVGKEAIILGKDELGMLRTLVTRGAMNLHGHQEDLKEFAERFIITTKEL